MDEQDAIWRDFILAKKEGYPHKDNNNTTTNINSNFKKICTNCEFSDFRKEHTFIICGNCGLTINDDIYYEEDADNQIFSEEIQTKVNNYGSSNKMLKMQKWLQWTNSEKNDYKLKKYTRDLCEKLKINEGIIEPVCELVLQIMHAIKKQNDGPKRSRVKDGIIIACIYYTSKNLNSRQSYSYIDLAKQINLDIKYISKADKIIMELTKCSDNNISGTCLNIDKNIISQTEKPLDYVLNSINNYKLNIDNKIIKKIQILIDICEDNDILLDHTPLSIGATCFYYLLIENSINIDTKLFSEMYNLSTVTIIKTYNKLLTYRDKINKYLDTN
jgi:transcription initiation factor TFIIIB Brf1 subunit/transcription initiation factor TFIIB